MKKLLAYSLGAAVLLTVSSCGNKVTTSIDNQTDSLSYAFGVMNGASMADAKATGMYPELNDLDIDLYLKGVKEGMNSSKEQQSYYLGVTQGSQIKQYFERMANDPGAEFDKDVFFSALAQSLKGDTNLLISSQDARGVYQEMIEKAMKAKEQAELDSIANTPEAKANLEAGMAFLAAKEQEEGVQKTESGLLYKVVKPGNGKQIKATDRVELGYVGKFINDSIFDQNAKTRFSANQGIPGWNEGLQMMSPGAKYIFYIPSELAYGVRGAGSRIPSNSTLVFEVEVFDFIK